MVDITIFRIDLGGSSFTATQPFGGDGEDDEGPDEPEGGGRGRGVAILAGLVFLLVVALLVKRVRDGDRSPDTA